MTRFISRSKFQRAIAIATTSLVFALASGSLTFAQMPADAAPDAPIPQPPAALSQNDLANLVAPIALYPDALFSQVLVACTYPLELVEAQQWLQQNGNLQSRELIQAAQQQNWDPSVQALVAFPDVLALLNRNVRWTTDLGNAFLAQQSDVMNAIQNLRADARQKGQLESTPQLSVNTETQGDQSAIEIQPADPQTMYVPSYNPSAVWGAPAQGSYPALPYAGSGFGSLFSTVANLAGLLPGFGGLLGPKSWGWALGWLAQTLFVNNSFFNDFGFHNSAGGSFSGGYGESSVWVHNSHHRLGVPYGNSFVASSHGGREREGWKEWRGAGTARQPGNEWRTFGSATRGISSPEPRRTFAPHSSTGRESFGNNRTETRTARADNGGTFNNRTQTPSAGQSARTFSQPSRTTAQTNDRGFQPNRSTGRDPYLGNTAYNGTRAFAGTRSFTNSRSFGSSRDAYANPSTTRNPETSRTAKSGSWAHLPHFSKARVSSQYGSSQRGSSQHFSKPKHFSAPKFKAPKAPKSHGGHSSGGHSSKRSHRG